jgi:nucleoid-associated protein
MIKVKRYVIHEVKKNVKETVATVEFSAAIGAIDDFAIKLVDGCHLSFSESPALKHTQFESGHSNVYHTNFVNYLGKDDDATFYDFTVKSLKDLKIRIEKEQFATGGYYLFVDYEYDNRRFIAVVLLRKKDGINLSKVKDVYILTHAENLNIEKIAMGFRLNHAIYSAVGEDKNYIALVANQKDKLSSYFKNWVQAGGVISDEQNTKSLITLVNHIDLPKNENGEELYSRDEFKRQVFELVYKSPEKTANLISLSEYFYGEDKKNVFTDYAQENQLTIDPVFKRTPTLKKLITIHARVAGIELHVDFDKLNSNEVDVSSDKVIIRSKELASEIIKQRDA